MRESKLRLLLLFANYTDRLSYYDDWHDALRDAPEFDVTSLNIVPRAAKAAVAEALSKVDAVVLLHSTNGDTTNYLEPIAPILRARKCVLLSFVGNEVSLPGSPIAAKRDVFRIIHPDFIATQLLLESGEYLFGDVVKRAVVAIPHALNPAAFRPEIPDADRDIDIGARAVRYLPHLGDDDRNRILDLFRTKGPQLGLTVDIANTRFTRSDWAHFLNRCKATISSEAGTWFLERDDTTVNKIRDFVLSKQSHGLLIPNDSALRKWGHKLPWRLRELARKAMRSGPIRHESLINENLDAEEILEKFFKGREKPVHHGKCISSRHFDGIGTKTCQIMIRGRFNDILEADRHYIAMNEDLSDLADAVEKFRDEKLRREIAEHAYEHVIAHHTYSHRAKQVYDVLTSARP